MKVRASFYVFLFLAPAAAALAAEGPTFEDDVRPILKANCFHCHGEEKELKAGLDLRFRKQIAAAEVIRPGSSASSKLYDLVSSGEMPPKKEHRLTEDEVAIIARWIDANAPAGEEPEVIPAPGAFVMTAAERNHWAFQPIEAPDVDFGDEHPIDFFVRRKLEAAGLDASPAASRYTLIRRTFMDLLGLPPSPAEMERHLTGDFSAMIDELLANEHYGERWARHWLDIAGYADSEGYNDKDVLRKGAWRYRDYVIDAHNNDLPWDQFISEQLAGDELAGATAENARFLGRDSEVQRLITATGFLRMGPDGTHSQPMDLVAAQNSVITETVKIVSSSLLGMTIGCAECHHHRFDPIPQEDFYAMRAIFAPVYDTTNWRLPYKREVGILTEEEAKKTSELSVLNEAAKKNKLDRMHEVVKLIFEREIALIPEEKRAFARETFETPAAERNEAQVALFETEYPSLNVSISSIHLHVQKYDDGKELTESWDKFQKEADEVVAKMPKSRILRAATELSEAKIPETRVFYRGDHNSPEGDPIEPRGLTAVGAQLLKSPDGLPTSGRRLAYASHLTSGDHPLVARVLVNRFWKHHFGQGLVQSPDFGSRGDKPSHPELLDWLAADFMANGWKLKRLHKLILTSQTYQQSSARRPAAAEIDPDNRLLWRMPIRRLEAEAVRDSILAISGGLKPEIYGEPLPVAVNEGGVFGVEGDRRSIYIQVRRTQPVTMLQAFDAPAMEPNCEQRVSSTVTTQSLAILNGEFVLAQAGVMAESVANEAETQPDQAKQAWRRAFGREPDASELASLESYLAKQTEMLKDERKALASLCQVLMGANEFLYID